MTLKVHFKGSHYACRFVNIKVLKLSPSIRAVHTVSGCVYANKLFVDKLENCGNKSLFTLSFSVLLKKLGIEGNQILSLD